MEFQRCLTLLAQSVRTIVAAQYEVLLRDLCPKHEMFTGRRVLLSKQKAESSLLRIKWPLALEEGNRLIQDIPFQTNRI